MNFLKYFETLWKIAIALAIFTAVFNIFKYQTIDYNVYLPIVCGIMSFVLWRNLKGQREFMEKMKQKREAQEKSEEMPAEEIVENTDN
jgi:hypothetical protein